jgi:OOP family OmpA-OmpF porin
MLKTICLRATVVVSVVLSGISSTAAQDQDVDGSKDHPLISRYQGSFIRDYIQKEYDEFVLPLGKATSGKFDKTQPLEGKVTYILYISPAGRSELEVFRNYQAALQKAGFETLFTCVTAQCGDGSQLSLYGNAAGADWGPGSGIRYLSGKLSRPEGDVYLSLAVGNGGWYGAAGPGVQIFAVEMKPMATGLVTVNAESLGGDITRTGHSAVYGIYFDTGKSDVKPQSDAALAEIAKLLQHEPNLKLHVVGHTDNVGTMASNMDLSLHRADAVARVLTTKYSIAAARLDSQGVGPLAPVASNDSEDGRGKNRRVELVKQ